MSFTHILFSTSLDKIEVLAFNLCTHSSFIHPSIHSLTNSSVIHKFLTDNSMIRHSPLKPYRIWNVKYNHFHDQLVITSSSDGRVILNNLPSISSEPYGNLIADEEDYEKDEEEDSESKSRWLCVRSATR